MHHLHAPGDSSSLVLGIVRPILVVEDDEDSRDMMATLLAAEGYRTIVAANGAQALEMARNEHPSLILLDLMMPVMDGASFRHAQWLDAGIADIPIVLVSAHPRAREIARELKAVDVVTKPVSFDALLRAVRASYEA